jgi:Clp amino terminal domain, pathogenicity island component
MTPAGWHAGVVPGEEMSGPYLAAIRRGFWFAGDLGCGCGPVHFLVGIAEGHGAAAAALDPGQGPSLRAVVTAAGNIRGDGAGFLHMQAQDGARSLAQARGQDLAAEHLLIALLDQGTSEVLQTLSRAGLDSGAVRRAALAAIGAAASEPRITLPALTPAGTLDRPPLPAGDLDGRAWTALQWRQDHLPLSRVRRRSDWDALSHLERKAAWRLTTSPALDDDQRYSLIWHHADQVEQRLARARPDLARPRRAPGRPTAAMVIPPGRRRRRRTRALRFTVGWAAWFGNRRTGLRDRWFRLRTIRYYRGAPRS